MTVIQQRPGSLSPRPDRAPQSSLGQRWSALHGKVAQIAQMADLSPEPLDQINTRFNNALSRTGALFGNHAHPAVERGVEDMEILVDMGLTALNEVESRGQDPGAPAFALWREVFHAREAILSVMEPTVA
ncbi:hypothetical protein EH31_12080 [Erythrobacter longus]|uniref:Uncharacterized protein n=1 Tax=Erythrobacter longus TaxID=1044 RepID=A0A074MC00_ERYLO|nr:hypothetical protein [Erythrobacter longus]KEO89378.1 hypothetical protein EH31_12080 [Erythrobacter longus]